MQDHKLWIYGTVPDPVGGVSVFLSRLIDHSHEGFAGLVDPYFANRKVLIPITHVRAKRAGTFEKAKVMSYLCRLRNSPLLINGSRPESILAIAPLLSLRTARTGLILHHGNLQKTLEVRPWLRHALVWALGRYQVIGCLSLLQYEFYKSLGITDNRLQLVETYLPPSAPSIRCDISARTADVLTWIRSSQAFVFVGSGYAHQFYRHDWGLDYLNDPKSIKPSRYLLCCYGPETDHLEELRNKFENRMDAKLVFGLRPEEFDIVLSSCQAYVRPSDTDSYGMAARDAAGHGLPVIASDACERPLGTRLHSVGDKTGFFDQLSFVISNCSGADKSDGQPAGTERMSRIAISTFLKNICQL